MKKLILALIFLFACQAPAPAYVNPPRTQPSVFKITTAVDGVDMSSGTAWIAHYSRDFDMTFLVTAGHVCNADEPDEEGERSYKLTSRFDKEFKATEVKRMFLKRAGKDEDRWPIDLCLLQTSGYISQPLPIMARDPFYGERVFYVGAPLGIWGKGEAPMYEGLYSGGELVTLTGTGGASVSLHR